MKGHFSACHNRPGMPEISERNNENSVESSEHNLARYYSANDGPDQLVIVISSSSSSSSSSCVLPEGRSFTASAGTYAEVIQKARLPPQTQEPRLQFYQGFNT